MKMRHVCGFSLLLASLSVCGCAAPRASDSATAHDNMDSVLWVQASIEYAGAAASTYAAATVALEEIARSEPDRTSGMAVVLDIDETVLDNSRYQAQLVFDEATYESASWDRWIALRAADPVPGVVDFIRVSQSLGIHVAFITNRACRARPDSDDPCPQKEDTFANLREVGIDTTSTMLFLRGDQPSAGCEVLLTESERADGRWSSNKTSRRECVRLDYEVVMLFGDQLGDFIEEQERRSGESGRDAATKYGEYWGKSWFMLPNPTYGDWRPNDSDEKRDRIRGLE